MARRLLLVSHVFPPQVAGGAARMGQFARMLPDAGWDVTVVTARHGAGAIDRAAEDAVAGRATSGAAPSPAARIVRRGQPVAKRGVRGLSRRVLRAAALTAVFPDREVFWVPGAIAAGARALRRVPHDVVLATHGPASNLIVGRALARAFGLPLVVDFRDLWATLPMPVFTTPLHRAAARALERAVVRAAARVIAVAPRMAEALAAAHGIDARATAAITNGFDPDDRARVHDDRPAGPRPFRLMYTGSVHAHYDLAPLWQAVQALAAAGRIDPASFRIEFVGNLAASDVRAHGLEAFVELRPFVPHDRVFDALARADALLVVETPGYYAEYGYAAKVFDYLLTGKPIVALVERGGNTARLLDAAGVGYAAEPGDAAGLRAALEAVLARKGAAPRAVDCDAAPLRAFNRRHLGGALAGVLDEAAARRGARA